MSIKKDKYYSASADIARRTGVINSRYRTKDGRFILSDKDLGRARLVMTPEEYINGMDVTPLTDGQAKKLIAQNDYQLGDVYDTQATETTEPAETETEQQEEEETTNETE